MPLDEGPAPEAGEAMTPTEPAARPARRRAGKAGPAKRGKTAAKRKPGKKVAAAKRKSGSKPRKAQKKGPKKAAAKKTAKTRRTRGRR
jgi:hypothetical protein